MILSFSRRCFFHRIQLYPVSKPLLLYSTTKYRQNNNPAASLEGSENGNKISINNNSPVNGFKISHMGLSTEKEVTKLFNDNFLQKATNANIAELMMISAKAQNNNTLKKISYIKDYLPRIAIQLGLLSNTKWHSNDISNVISGLKYMKLSDDGVSAIIKEMTEIIYLSIDNEDIDWSSQNLSTSLLGLQSIGCDDIIIEKLLRALSCELENCRYSFSPSAISGCLYGLQAMNASNIEVCNILQLILSKIIDCKYDFNGTEIGNALFGLQKMSIEDNEVSDIITALTIKIAQSSLIFDEQSILKSFVGLQSMNKKDPRVLDLLSIIADKIRDSKDNFSSLALSRMFNR